MRLPLAAVLTVVTATAVRGQSLVDDSLYAAVLSAHVVEGLVDYEALQRERADLDGYIAALGRVSGEAVRTADRATRLAFWINAYNACTLRLVVDHYPIERRGGVGGLVNRVRGMPANSIRQIPETFTHEFCDVAGEVRSLDEIEHEIVRPLGEPRIHFAVNCASRSCPTLADTPYAGVELNTQLDAAVARFMAERRHFRLERGARPVVHVNKVLDWYGDDFGGADGVLAFLVRYMSDDDRAYVEGRDVRLAFEDYDWTLNDVAVFGRGSSQ